MGRSLKPVEHQGHLWCGNCRLSLAKRAGRCWACLKHFEQRGHERPAELVQKQKDRYFRRVYA